MPNYFVTFWHVTPDGRGNGFGNASVPLPAPVSDAQMVQEMKRAVEENSSYTRVVVLGWQRYEED